MGLTVTVFKSPQGPSDTDGWMVRSFHSSSDVFDNAILYTAVRKALMIAGIGGLATEAFAAACLFMVLRRRRPGSRAGGGETLNSQLPAREEPT